MSWYTSLPSLVKAVAVSVATLAGGAPTPLRPVVLHPVSLHRDASRRMTCSTSYTAITPCTAAASAYTSSTGNTQNYQLQNKINTEAGSYFLSCAHTGAVASCSVPSSMTVPAASTKPFVLTYGAGATAGSGTVTVTVDDGFTPVVATLTVTIAAPPPPPVPSLHLISTYPHYQTWDADPFGATSAQFHIANKGFAQDTFNFTAACAGGGINGGCTPARGSKIVAAGADSVVSITITAGGPGSTGVLSFLARRTSDTTVRDSGSLSVLVGGGGSGTDISNANAGSSIDRGLCLSMALGVGAAYECGDLRLAHPLPGVRTLNSLRTPVLLYSSQHAHPIVVIAGDVKTGAKALDSVIVLLRGTAGDSLARGVWAGSQFPVNSSRRVALSFDAYAKSYATGIYPYSLIVRRKYGGSTATDSVAGEFVVVNRSTSSMGPGWWLAGFERLYKYGTDLLWVGGDGSTRHYVRQPSGTAWAAAGVDRPDTIKIVTSPAGYYERYLPHKLVVRFDTTTLMHVQTVNRLGQVTNFFTDAVTHKLDSIVVPAAVRRAYVFHYDASTHLRSIDAPSIPGTRRFDSLVVNGSNQITAIRDPDASVVSFTLDGGVTNRILSRVDQKYDTLTFTYGAGGLLASSSLSLDATHVIAQSFQPSESRGIAGTAAATSAQASTLVDGSRTDVGDTMRVWTDRFGAPRKIRNALGDETVLSRANATYPALVTRMQAPNGRIVSASYDARGNLLTSVDSSTYDATRFLFAKTTYTWDPTWDFVTKTVRPEGDNDSTSYDPSTGNRVWQQDGRGVSSRVSFFYYTSGLTAGLVRATQSAITGERDTVAYDATLGNLAFTQTPLGFRETVRTDSLGRVTRDSTPTTFSGDTAVIATHTFDLLDRDTLTITTGGSTTSQTALRVRTGYDSVGNVLWVRRKSVPDPNALDTVIRTYTYDRANRKLTEFPGGFYTYNWSYDPAGDVLLDGKTNATSVYDALGRPALRVGIDSARFVYDEMGQVLHAINGPARIHRHYAKNGTLTADTTQLATNNLANQNYSTYVSSFAPRYDLDLRRTALVMGTDSIRYHYAAPWGALDTLTDPFGHTFAWQYDPDGRVSQLTRYAERTDTNVVEQTTYDFDSRLARRTIMRGATAILRDTLVYDRRGKVVRNAWAGDTIAYTPLGHLRYGSYANAAGTESYTMDAAGNRVSRVDSYIQTFAYDPHTDLLRTVLRSAAFSWDTVSYGYDSKNDQVSEIHITPFTFFNRSILDTAKENRVTASAYTAGLMTASTYALDTIPAYPLHYQTYQRKESYRYDALGRRVWVELVRDTNCTTHDTSSDCSNYVRRVTWDGNQILHETQVAADTGRFDAIKEGGSVTYVHGGAIDQPLEVYKTSTNLIAPYVNWRGQVVAGTCPLAGCAGVTFPLSDASAFDDLQNGDANGTWFGTLIKGQLDASGYEYKRNRYYNPSTGRFNSEDPIGLAGGLNVYGYASGDPASYGDPFGLCPCNGDQFALQVGALLRPVQTPLEIAGTLVTLPLTATGEGAMVTLGLGSRALSATSGVFLNFR